MKKLFLRSIFLLIVAFILMNSAFAQTAIVAVRTPSALYLGADSLVGRWDGSEKWFACKIHNTDKIFSAYARTIAVEGSNFNIPDIADKMLRGTGTIEERISVFDVRIAGKLRDSLQELKDKQPDFFQKHANGRSASDVVFIGFENGEPRMFARWFMVSIKNNRVIVETRRRDCPGDCKTGTSASYLGHHETIDKILAANPRIWDRGFPEAIEFLIQEESSGEPLEVGGPIAVLEIDKDEYHWVRKGSCKP